MVTASAADFAPSGVRDGVTIAGFPPSGRWPRWQRPTLRKVGDGHSVPRPTLRRVGDEIAARRSLCGEWEVEPLREARFPRIGLVYNP
jgi:hypothetical protein